MPPPSDRLRRFSSEFMPASPTKTHRFSFHPRRSAFTLFDRRGVVRVAREDPGAHGHPVAGHGKPHDDLGNVAPPVLRLAPLAKSLVLPPSGQLVAAASDLVLLVDLEVQRGRVIEDQVHVDVEEVRHPEEDRLLDLLLVRLQEVHRPVQVLQLETLAPRQENLLRQPLLVTVELGVRPQRLVGDHREQGPLEGLGRALAPGEVFQDSWDLQLRPEGVEHVRTSIRPALEHTDIRLSCQRLLAREHPQDAARKSAHRLGVDLVPPTEAVDDLGHGTALLGVPDVLGQLVVPDHGAIGVSATDGAQVHA